MTTACIPRLALYVPLRCQPFAVSSQEMVGVATQSRFSISRVVDFILHVNETVDTTSDSIDHDTRHRKTKLISGVEASLAELGVDPIQQIESADIIRNAGLNLVVNIPSRDNMSANNIYANDIDPLSGSDAIKSFESRLRDISNLGKIVTHINCREEDLWSVEQHKSKTPNHEDQALDFLLEILPISAQFLEEHPYIGKSGNETDVMGGSPPHLIGISHETCGGIHHHPRITRHLLEVVPPLRLSMNLAYWHEVCGYPWGFGHAYERNNNGDDEAEALSIEILPHIDYIRVPTSLFHDTGMQTRTAYMPVNEQDRNLDPYPSIDVMHTSLWNDVWARKARRGVNEILMCFDALVELQNLEISARYIHGCFDNWSKQFMN